MKFSSVFCDIDGSTRKTCLTRHPQALACQATQKIRIQKYLFDPATSTQIPPIGVQIIGQITTGTEETMDLMEGRLDGMKVEMTRSHQIRCGNK